MKTDLARRTAAEFIGTAFLLATVVGSGIMAERLAGGTVALALLANTLATGAMLFVLIVAFIDLSGAHFNPAVTFSDVISRKMRVTDAGIYFAAQVFGGIGGVIVANLLFDLPSVNLSTKIRNSTSLHLSEFIATFGLVLFIGAAVRLGTKWAVPLTVAGYISAAYWFTSSTSFANPAVTIARTLSDSFAGIRPADAPGFIGAQFLGTLAATFLGGWLFRRIDHEKESSDTLHG